MRKVLVLAVVLVCLLTVLGKEAIPDRREKEDPLLKYLKPGEVNKAVAWLWEFWGWEVELILWSMVWKPFLEDAGIKYKVIWEEEEGLLWPRVFVKETVPIKVSADPVARFLAWYGLRDIPLTWVAKGSSVEKARESWERATLHLDRPIIILLSCPTKDYEDRKTRMVWEEAIAHLQVLKHLLNEMGVKVEVVDLSAWTKDDAVNKVKEALLSEGVQVLGFFHRGDTNSFEVGQGGQFGLNEIKEVGKEARRLGKKADFVTIIGCNSLFFGLNDAFIEEGLTDCTFTVATEFNIKTMRDVIESFLRFVEEQWNKRQKAVPLKEVEKALKQMKLHRMGKISNDSFC